MTVSITPIGHATVLLSFGDYHLITDPVLMDKIGISAFSFGKKTFTIGHKRLNPPAIKIEELPKLQAILLSHAHFDHTDLPTLKRLPKETTMIVQKGNKSLVRRFSNKHVLRWGESTWLDREGQPFIQVTSTPAKHWGARMLLDQWRGWGGYLLEIPSIPSPHWPEQPLSILFAGDTAQTTHFQKLREERNGKGIDLAIMPIGAYDPWIFNHCSPEQAWQMAIEDLGAHWFMPVHHETFRLSKEEHKEPITRLLAHAIEKNQQDKIVGMELGQSFVVRNMPHS